jgi:hypothetical protein
MNEISQLATAMAAIVFAAVILVWGQLFIEYRREESGDARPVCRDGASAERASASGTIAGGLTTTAPLVNWRRRRTIG